MADKFPSNIGSTPFSLADTFDRARSLAGQIKYATQDLSKASAAGPVSAVTIKQFAGGLAQQRQQMAALAATTGLPAYVQQQYPTLDLVASYTAVIGQVDATIAWMLANFPKATSGELLTEKWNPVNDGTTIPDTFTVLQLATFKTVLDALVATID